MAPKPLDFSAPFSAADVDRIKSLFQPPARPGFPTAAELEAERSGLASFLGTTDYGKQLEEDRQLSRLQLGLALAQRGFGSMGAQPRVGEAAISTVGRELFAPLAGDAGAIATQLLQKRRAIQSEQRQEERQLKLAALQQVQTRQGQAYADELAATNAAREFLIMSEKKDVQVSDAFTVDGVPVPVMVEKDYRGNIRYLDANNNEIAANRIGVYKAPKVIKDKVDNVSDIERIVVDADTGEETYREVVVEKITSYNSDGSVRSTVLRDVDNGHTLHLSGPNKNARKKPEEGSRTSLYYAPDRKNIYLNQPFVDAFGLPNTMVGEEALLEISSPKPKVGAGLAELVKVRVAGKTYALRDHKDYNPETGNIELETPQGLVTLDSSQLWRLDDPKAFTALVGGALTVPPENLAAIRAIPGLSGVESGAILTSEENPAGDIRIRYGPVVIDLNPAQVELFQRGPLSERQEIVSGRTPQKWEQSGTLTVVTEDNLVKSIPGLENITAGEEIEIHTLPQISGMGAGKERKYFYKGQEVNITPNQLNTGAFRVGPLSETQRLEAGLDTAKWTKQESLRVPPANLAAIQQIPGLEDITTNATLQVERDQLGNTRILRGTQEIDLTAEEEALFVQRELSEVEEIAGKLKLRGLTKVSDLTVGEGDLAALQAVPGLENIGPNEKIDVYATEGDPSAGIPIEREYWYGGTKVDLTQDLLQSGVLQSAPLSEVQKVKLKLVEEDAQSYVNTTGKPQYILGAPVGVGQRVNLTRHEYNTLLERTPGARSWLQAAGPVDTAGALYTVLEPRTIDNIEYAPGDQVPLNPSEYEALHPDIKNALTSDPDVKKAVLKMQGFKALFRRVAEENRIPYREPTNEELESLLVMFPAGMRSGGKYLRDEVFDILKYGIKDEDVAPSAVMRTSNRELSYQDMVNEQLNAAEVRYNEAVKRGALAQRPWASLSFEDKRAFANLPDKVQLRNMQALWAKAAESLATTKSKFTTLDSDDVAAYAAATELLIYAKYLRDTQGLDDTGRFFGWLGSLRATTFADLSPITSGGTQRLQQIINAMKASYATLAGAEGEGRPSNFRISLQQDLLPAFDKAENLNARNLNTIIRRLEASLASAFDPEVLSTTVIPRSFERMAADAGVPGSIDPTRYPWINPDEARPPPVTRQKVMEAIGLTPFTFKDAQNLKEGRKLPPGDDGVQYVKIKDNEDGSIVVREAGSDGRPKSNAKSYTITAEHFIQGQ